MSRPLRGTQQHTADGWHEVEAGVRVTDLAHLVEETRFNEGALLKLIRGGGVAVERRESTP